MRLSVPKAHFVSSLHRARCRFHDPVSKFIFGNATDAEVMNAVVKSDTYSGAAPVSLSLDGQGLLEHGWWFCAGTWQRADQPGYDNGSEPGCWA